MIKVNRIKMYRSSTDPSICYVHSTDILVSGKHIELAGERCRIKEVLVSQRSKHWPGHTFYEIKLHGNRS